MSVVVFKKRGKRKKKGKHRQASTVREIVCSELKENDDVDDQDEDEFDVDMLKSEQRMRMRRKQSSTLTLERRKKRKKRKKESETLSTGGVVDARDAVQMKQKLDGLLSGSFSTEKNHEARTTNELLEKYIAEKMENREPRTENHDENDQVTEEDRVYVVPEKLRPVAARGTSSPRDSSSGGPMAFGTGIAEVELPLEYKLKNIEETELAKSRVFGKPRKIRAIPSRGKKDTLDQTFYRPGMSGNLTSNFKHHQRVYRDERREGRTMANALNNPKKPRKPISNDDRAFYRFKRRENNRRR